MKRKANSKATELAPRKKSFIKENVIDIISLVLSIISLAATIFIGIQANDIAKLTQPLEYVVAADDKIEMFVHDEKMYTTGGINFKQLKGGLSGKFSSLFLATVKEDDVDVVYIPYKNKDDFEFVYDTNTELTIKMSDEISNKLLFSPFDASGLEAVNDKIRMFHLIFKGYNKEYEIYTVIYTLGSEITQKPITDNEKEYTVPMAKVNCYIFDDDNIYKNTNYQPIADDLNKHKPEGSKITDKQIFETVLKERKLCCAELNAAH